MGIERRRRIKATLLPKVTLTISLTVLEYSSAPLHGPTFGRLPGLLLLPGRKRKRRKKEKRKKKR
jgi:hypothetical protein